MQRKLTLLETDDDQLKKTRAGEIARITDVTERWHGGGAAETEARVYKDRLAALETLQRILGRAEPQDVVVSQVEALEATPATLPEHAQTTEGEGVKR